MPTIHLRRSIRIVAINVAVFAGMLIVLESAASAVLVLRDVRHALLARPSWEYDPDLGWVGRSRVRLPDFFGRGIGVQTNGQRFRASDDIQPAVAPGRVRVICSGDSFTFGDGVDNSQTWCQILSVHDRRIEPVNLGESGYGADQAYIRFLRDTRGLAYQVHLFAFINDDFERMRFSASSGFGKPVLTLDRGALVVGNVPVPRTMNTYPWLVAIPQALAETRLASLVARVFLRHHPVDRPHPERDVETQAVVRAMFVELKRVNAARSSTFILVHLPTLGELDGVDPWSSFVHRVAEEEQLPLIDVVGALSARTDARDLFLYQGIAAGHYNRLGHLFVAEVVADGLKRVLGR